MTPIHIEAITIQEKTILILFILCYEIGYKFEYRSVACKDCCLEGIVDCMIVLESVALLILQENAGHTALCKRIMVAVGGKVATVQALEILLVGVDLLKK